MLRPTSLYRSNSRREPALEANANNITKDSIDCGFWCCQNSHSCQKMANKKSLIILLIACGLIQGGLESYFKISAKQFAQIHDYDQKVIDWLLVASGIFQGIFAIFLTYWGNRLHRTGWLGGILMVQACICIMIIIPTLIQHSEKNDTLSSIELSILCIRHRSENLLNSNIHGLTTLILLFVLQFGIALGIIAFYTLGFSYLDDNVHEHESPALISSALAAKFFGVQIGSLISLFVGWTSFGWFLGFIIIAPILFIIGFVAFMFPKTLLSSLIRQAANNILETSTNISHASLSNRKFIADISFFPSLARIFTNKIVIFNTIAAVFVQTAFVNFNRHESNYLQSRFFLPSDESDDLNDQWTSQLVSKLLKPPMLALTILASGLIISKANPSARKIIIWNISVYVLVAAFFIVSIFIDCEHLPIAGAHRGKIIKPYCAHSCLCSDNTHFMPVCPENGIQTFYSPCHAGCGAEIFLNNVRVFGNCSCGTDIELPMEDVIATEGACNMDACQKFWISFQALIIFASALIASTLVGKLIISIRAVLPQDKSLVLSFELFLIGLTVYIPGKILYRVIADNACQYFAPDGYHCFLHETRFGTFINIATAALILIGLIFEIINLFAVSDLMLYGDDEEPNDYRPPIEMNTYRNLDVNINEPLLQNVPPPLVQENPNGVTYAQIQRHNNLNNDVLDFRPQTANNGNDLMSENYSLSSNGYMNLSQVNSQDNQQQNVTLRNRTSPETSF